MSLGRPPDLDLQARRRESILDGAAVLFAEKGYSNADTQHLADSLGIAKGTIYRYFPSKQELFFATVRQGTEGLRTWIASRVAAVEDEFEQLFVALEAALEYFERHPDFVELMVLERAHFKSRRSTFFEHEDPTFKAQWIDRIRRLMDAGRLLQRPPEDVVDVTGDLLFGTMFVNYLSGRPSDYRLQARNVIDLLYRGLLTDAERARWEQSETPSGPLSTGDHARE